MATTDRKDYFAAYRAAHRDKAREYRETHRDEQRAYMATWQAEHKEEQRQKKAAYTVAHRDEKRAYDAARQIANPEQNKAKCRAWAAANPDKKRSGTKAWNAANREHYLDISRAARARRRVRQRAAQSSVILLRDWRRLVNRYGQACAYCRLPQARLHQEHIIPLARGGRHSIGNLLPVCGPCNSSKGRKLLIEWRAPLAATA